MTEPIDCIIDYTTRLNDSDFDALIAKTLEDEQEDDWALDRSRVQGMMFRTLLTIANSAIHHRDYDSIINEGCGCSNSMSASNGNPFNEYDSICSRFAIHGHDILLDDYTDLSQTITYMNFLKILKDRQASNDNTRTLRSVHQNVPAHQNLLALRYKNGSFTLTFVGYSSDSDTYRKNYSTGNIALYFVPSTIKRMAGRVTAKGKDIIMKYAERLLTYGYRIKGNEIEGIAHTISEYDAENLTRSLRLINNAMHNDY